MPKTGDSEFTIYDQPETLEDKAKYLFNKAVLLEQQGRHYDAIKFYRMAMQIDENVEFKIGTSTKAANTDSQPNENVLIDNTGSSSSESTQVAANETVKSLYELFKEIITENKKFCEKNVPQKVKS